MGKNNSTKECCFFHTINLKTWMKTYTNVVNQVAGEQRLKHKRKMFCRRMCLATKQSSKKPVTE